MLIVSSNGRLAIFVSLFPAETCCDGGLLRWTGLGWAGLGWGTLLVVVSIHHSTYLLAYYAKEIVSRCVLAFDMSFGIDDMTAPCER